MDSSEIRSLFINNFTIMYDEDPTTTAVYLITTLMTCMVKMTPEERMAINKLLSFIGDESFEDIGDFVSYLGQKMEEGAFGQGV